MLCQTLNKVGCYFSQSNMKDPHHIKLRKEHWHLEQLGNGNAMSLDKKWAKHLAGYQSITAEVCSIKIISQNQYGKHFFLFKCHYSIWKLFLLPTSNNSFSLILHINSFPLTKSSCPITIKGIRIELACIFKLREKFILFV